MPILVIAGRGRRATLDISGWTPTQVQGAILAAEIDGYNAHTGYGKKEN